MKSTYDRTVTSGLLLLSKERGSDVKGGTYILFVFMGDYSAVLRVEVSGSKDMYVHL
jgi:hypothetical protein